MALQYKTVLPRNLVMINTLKETIYIYVYNSDELILLEKNERKKAFI